VPAAQAVETSGEKIQRKTASARAGVAGGIPLGRRSRIPVVPPAPPASWSTASSAACCASSTGMYPRKSRPGASTGPRLLIAAPSSETLPTPTLVTT
jgi:hypothetical protein